MTSVGVMASAVVTSACINALQEPFDNLTAWTIAGALPPSIVVGRTGAGASFPTGSVSSLTYTIPAISESDTVTVGVAFKAASWGGGETNIVELRSDAGATLHNAVSIRNDGTMLFYTGTSGQAGPVAGFTAGTWAYLEVQTKLHDTTGFYTVKINGTTIMSGTNADTKSAGTKTTYDSVRLQCANGPQIVFDDLYVSTGAGCVFQGDHTITPTPPAPASPIPVTTGLQLWLDAEDSASFSYSSGVVVSQWNDKSGNNRHHSQATVGNQPIRIGRQNGRSVVTYDGSNDHLRTPSAPVSTVTDNLTVFAACMRTGGGVESVVFHNGAPNSNGYGLALRANSANVGLLRAAIAMDSTATPNPAAPCVLSLQRSAGTWGLWLNGTATNMASTGGVNTPSTTTEVTSDTHLFGGDVYEVAFYDRVLTTTERQQVESYLKTKWGTP